MPRLAPAGSWARPFLVLLAAGALAHPALADEDDHKLRTRKPAIVHPIVRGAPGTPEGPFQVKNVQLKSWIPLSNFAGFPGPGGSGADCWGYTSPSGREYALMGLSWGNGIVEVTDPANPVIIATIPGGVNSLWRDIAVVGNRAYAVSDGSGVGIQVINLAGVDQGQATLIANVSQGGHVTSHTLLQNAASGFLYSCGSNLGGGGVLPISTANPNNPTFSGPGWTNTYTHECQVHTYTGGPYTGKEILFAFITGGGLAIVDVTNKAAPITLSQTMYPSVSYSHQGWLHSNGTHLYLDDELDGGSVPNALTRVFDVSNLANPRLVAAFTNGRPAIDHNQYVNGSYLFQSNYATGIRVWDVTDPLAPEEVAWIDTYPEDDEPNFVGTWGNYPFFGSGTILASDLNRGLFVLKVSLLKIKFLSTPSFLVAGQPTTITCQITQRDAAVDPATVRLSYAVNGGFYQASLMTPLVGGWYEADLPPQACGNRVEYYISCYTTDGRLFASPGSAPTQGHEAIAGVSETTVFSDNFETDQGWTAGNAIPATTGKWVRSIPAPNAGHGAPVGDADGSGRAWVTGNLPNEEVNGGPTRLTSPTFNLAAHPDAVLNFAYWLLSIQNSTDTLRVELSSNNGASWFPAANLGPSGGWRARSIRFADTLAPTAQCRVRFSVSDLQQDSLTEAGIDAFSITSAQCPACYPDCTLDSQLTIADFGCFQTKFVAGDPYADCNGAGGLTIADFGCFQTAFVAGCP